MRFICPPREEQDQIVRFLDWKISRINKLINAKKKQIALLKELKITLINKVVVRNSDNCKKRQLKSCVDIMNGKDYKDIEINEGGFPVIGSGDEFAKAKNFIYDKPSVLFGRKGTVDKPIYIDSPFWSVDTMFYTIIHKDINPKYLYYSATQIDFSRYATHTAIPSMRQRDLGKQILFIPSLEEQNAIAAKLDVQCAIIQRLTDEIELFIRYRTRLISDVVTGKIDVRNIVVPEHEKIKDVSLDDDEEIEDETMKEATE
jgi:type I restriction enzyme S subunit